MWVVLNAAFCTIASSVVIGDQEVNISSFTGLIAQVETTVLEKKNVVLAF